MMYFVTNFYWVGEGEVFLLQNGGRSRFCCHGWKVEFQYKSDNYLRRGDGNINIALERRSILQPAQGLFQNDLRQDAIKPQLLQQVPVSTSLCSPPKHFPFSYLLYLSFLLSSLASYSNNDPGRNLSDIAQPFCLLLSPVLWSRIAHDFGAS